MIHAVAGAIVSLLDRSKEAARALPTRLWSIGIATCGAVGFLTRLPVGNEERHWTAFRRRPVLMVPVGAGLGALLALPVVAPLPAVTAALCFPVWLLVLTGITHWDGLADFGDAMVVHGDSKRRRTVMRDTTVGVGALAATGLGIAGLVLGAHALATMPARVAFAIVVAGEVGAKLGMVAIAALGRATHDGLGSSLTAETGPGTLAVGVVCALAIVALSWPGVEAAVALSGSTIGTAAVLLSARRTLGGVSGDVFGATNELARLTALHAGVIAWTL
jgi:adenosylcobinamide-GDP ribazoletransferase